MVSTVRDQRLVKIPYPHVCTLAVVMVKVRGEAVVAL